jgi:hypothetical protein
MSTFVLDYACKHVSRTQPLVMLSDDSIQSMGGKARAEALSDEQKTEIAKKAADARWAKPVAHYEGTLNLGKTEVSCAVVEIDGEVARLISSAGFMMALGRPWKGSYKRTDRPNFIDANNLKGFITPELEAVLQPIEYRTPGGGVKRGYRAEIVPLVCEVYLEARDEDELQSSQHKIAKACEIIMRSLAKLGIVALVDEATGYQYVRDRLALQTILEKYVTDEWAKWTRRFPSEFYKQLFRLRGLPFPPAAGTKKPQYVGHWTNDIVYDRLTPGLKQKLREVNPKNESGSRSRKHHQHLTEDVGVPELQQHLSNVMFLMKTCNSWTEFKNRLDIAQPKVGHNLLLNLPAEEEK